MPMKQLQLGRSIPIRLVLKTVRFFCHVITFADGLSSFNVNTFVKVMTRTYCITLDPKNCNAVLIMSFLCYWYIVLITVSKCFGSMKSAN